MESKHGRRGSTVPVHDLRIQQLQAEVERLREALEEISKDYRDPQFECASIAQRALDGEP